MPLGQGPLDARDLESWEALAAAAAEPNPFFEPAFTLPAVEHLGEHGISLLVVEDDGGWRACMPVQRTRLARVAPAQGTWTHLYCFLGTPLLDGAHAEPAARELLAFALDSGRPLKLERLVDDGPVATAVARAAEDLELVTIEEARYERALLERRSEATYLDGLRSHRRRELNRLHRRLEAHLGSALTVSDQAGQDGAIDRFLELERSGWKGRSETALGSSAGHSAFFRSVCESFASEGRLQLLALAAEGRTVAMKCNLYAGEGSFCFKIAYDEQLAAFSPGVQLERENVHIFHDARSERWQDSCADPDNEMINRLWPDRRAIHTAVLATGSVRAAALSRTIKAVRDIRDLGRRRAWTRS